VRPLTKKLLELLPLGVLLPLGIGAASVNPYDAVSNVSKWAEILGVSDVPAWLARKSADRLLVEICVALSIAYLLFLFRRPLARFALRGERAERRDAMVPVQGVSATGAAGTVTPSIDWLTPLAEKDDQEIEHRLLLIGKRISEIALAAGEPFIDFEFLFVNASVYELTLRAIDGRFKYLSHDLSTSPQMRQMRDILPEKQYVISHGVTRKFVLRQYLTAEAVQNIRHGRDANLLNEEVNIVTDYAVACFKYRNLTEQEKEVKKGLGSVTEI
jgi:hypothetical protein